MIDVRGHTADTLKVARATAYDLPVYFDARATQRFQHERALAARIRRERPQWWTWAVIVLGAAVLGAGWFWVVASMAKGGW